MKNNHMVWMALACIVPLLLVYLMPVFGIRSNYTAFIAIILMVGAHIFLMWFMGHDHGANENTDAEKKSNVKHKP